MATFPQENPIQGSPMIGSPIVVTVLPQTHQQQWTFHRVMLRVLAGLAVPDVHDPNYPSDADYTALEFSTPVDATTSQVVFDISSALQAVADRYSHDAEPPSRQPYVKFRIVAWDEWMVDGTVRQSDAALLPGSMGEGQSVQLFYFYAFLGALSDMERLAATSGSRQMLRWTRKPSDVPEVVFLGEDVVRPINFNTGLRSDYASEDIPPQFVSGEPVGGPRSVTYDVGQTEGLRTLGSAETGQFQVYAIQKPRDGYVLRFQNGLGCTESLCLRCLAQKQVKLQTEQYTIARQETLNKFSRSLAVKSGNVEQWKMTSGPVSELWASWFIHELLMAQDAWVMVGTAWLRCHLLPEETVTLVDRTKTSPMEVQFTLQMDINGSPLSALAI